MMSEFYFMPRQSSIIFGAGIRSELRQLDRVRARAMRDFVRLLTQDR